VKAEPLGRHRRAKERLQDAIEDLGIRAILVHMVGPSSVPAPWALHFDSSEPHILVYRNPITGQNKTQHPLHICYQGMLALHDGGLARMQESLDCDPAPPEDIATMADYLGIDDSDPAFVREVRQEDAAKPSMCRGTQNAE
jgi:hypothetical protein